MNDDDRIFSAMQALAESDRAAAASPELETHLRQAFRHEYARRKRPARAVWTSVALAAAAAGVIIVMAAGHKPRPEPARANVEEPVLRVEPASPPVMQPAARRKTHRKIVAPSEIVTEFFPLTDVAPPLERGALVRVNLSAEALRAVGLPVDENHLADQVQADVLVGQEGIPRAIRFVKVSK